MTQAEGERLARFLAHAGVASRRHAEEMIAVGRVQVNGVTVTAQGTRILPEKDSVVVDGRLVQAPEEHVYILLHKPVGYICTAHDPQGRPTVLDLLPSELRQRRIYPVGRLDNDTSGLLLLTNDGNFALHMTHPRYAVEKHYEAMVRGRATEETLIALRKGVFIADKEERGRSYTTAPAQAHILRQDAHHSWLAITIHEGHKRQVRRMLGVLGLPVVALKRVGIGELTLRGVPVGKWRYITGEEMARLRLVTGMEG